MNKFPGWGLSWTTSSTHGTKFDREDNAAKITHVYMPEGLDYIEHTFEPLQNTIFEFDAKLDSLNNNSYSLVVESAPNGVYDSDGFWMSFNGGYLQIYQHPYWQNVSPINLDVWNHYRIAITINKLEIYVNGELKYNVAGTFSPRSYIRFRDYGYCYGPVISYIDNVKVETNL